MATKTLPSKDRLLQLLSYQPDTGALTWLPRPVGEFANENVRICNSWNTANAGKPALTRVNANGYLCGTLEGKSVLAHRVIWKLMTGKDPDQVDHGDGNRTNNAWVNLRDVDYTGNRRNASLTRRNKSGVPGVMLYTRWPGSKPVWWVRIGAKTLGYFEDRDEAIAVRKAAEIAAGYHENHGRPLRPVPHQSPIGD